MTPDDEILDLNLEPEEPLPPAVQPAGDVLEITLEDLEATAPTYPVADIFPAVTGAQEAAAKPGITLPCVCTSTQQAFEVRYEEAEPGVYYAVETTAVAGKAARDSTGGGEAMSAIQGNFRMGPDYRCPYCGNGSLSLCEHCQAVMCLGGIGKGQDVQCPGCGVLLSPTGGPATSAPARSGKGKGAQSKGW